MKKIKPKTKNHKSSKFPKLQPLMSEKSLTQSEHLNTYTFITEIWADKTTIKNLISKVYGVEVQSVRTTISVARLQMNRFGIFGGDKFKKCFVRLKEGSKINLTAGV